MVKFLSLNVNLKDKMKRGVFMFVNKKNIFLAAKCLICVFLFVGCHQKLDISYDSQYGVRYTLNDNNKESFVLVKLDPDNKDVVSMLRVWVNIEEDDNIPKETVQRLQSSSNNNLSLIDDMYSTFFYQEVKDNSFYVINLNLYMDDELETAISEEAKEIIEYIGLDEEFKDNVLYYEKELKNSQTFKFKWIIDNGTFNNNISLLQLEEYAYPKK